MTDLLFWFLVSQTIAGLPDMAAGTKVQILSADLLTVHAAAMVADDHLIFEGVLEPGQEIRLLILAQGADEKETVDALGKALYGRVSPEGNDILVQFEELDGPLSFGKWLAEERDITLDLAPPSEKGEDSEG